jgi:hypothetical protein
MKYAKAILFFIFATTPFFPCTSQEVKITSVPFPFDPSLSNIVGMCQDENGLIWLADNYNSLVKYDGTNKKYFKSNRNASSTMFLIRAG